MGEGRKSGVEEDSKVFAYRNWKSGVAISDPGNLEHV